VVKAMNIVEIPFIVEAKTMGNLRTKNVLYYFSESTHSLCLDKEAIMLAQVHACERLLDLSRDQTDTAVLEKEISKLRIAIEMMKS
jgi:hypothetical protein